MADSQQTSITRIIKSVSAGEGDVRDLDLLLSAMYEDLHALASRSFRGERADHTLQPTALVHEVYLRLIDQREVDWRDRNHFFALASEMIRRILVDHARSKRTAKRGGGRPSLLLEDVEHLVSSQGIDLAALDDALEELKAASPQQAKIVEMRFFGGLTIEEIAMVLDIGKRTVDREWAHARAWLFKKLGETGESGNGGESGRADRDS